MSAYRIATARPVPARRSWWRNAWRLANLNRRRRYHLTFAAGLRWLEAFAACMVFWAILRSSWAHVSAWPEPTTTAGWVLAFALSPVSWFLADVLLGYYRLQRARRAMRMQQVHVAPIHWGLAYTAHLSRCGRCTTVEPHCRAGRMLREGRVERDGVVYQARAECACCLAASAEECSADCPRGTLTTFPALAAYRELARTGDVEAFEAKDKRPVTRPIASIVGDAEAVMDAARRAQAAAEEVSEMLKERAQRGRAG